MLRGAGRRMLDIFIDIDSIIHIHTHIQTHINPVSILMVLLVCVESSPHLWKPWSSLLESLNPIFQFTLWPPMFGVLSSLGREQLGASGFMYITLNQLPLGMSKTCECS